MALRPVGAWEGGGCGNELGEWVGISWRFTEQVCCPRRKFLWVPSGLNHSVMGKTEAVEHRMSSVVVCGSV